MLAAVVLLAVAPTGSAWAHGEESKQARVLVEQAIALIANQAGDERIAERIHDAVEAPDQMGVDQAKVRGALAFIDQPGENARATAQAWIGGIAQVYVQSLGTWTALRRPAGEHPARRGSSRPGDPR